MAKTTINPLARRARLMAAAWAGAFITAAAAPLAIAPTVSAADGAKWPTHGSVTSVFGYRCLSRTADNHKGIDIATDPNDVAVIPVYATQAGKVRGVYWDGPGYGTYIIIDHSNGWSSLYGHLKSDTPTVKNVKVKAGDSISQEQYIANMGNTGGVSTGKHLHFEMRKNNVQQNFNGALPGSTNDQKCANSITAKSTVNFTFTGLNGTSGTTYEDVRNGGGTRITGPNSYLDISSQGHVYAWNSQWYGGNPSNYGARISDAAATNGAQGYWMVSTSGHIYAYGNAQWKGGSPTNTGGEIVAMAKMPNDDGYALLSETGNVYNYGSSQWKGGSPGNYSGKFVDIEMMPDGQGYWLLTSAGQIYAYGSAQSYGNATNFQRAIVAMSRTANGLGYVLVSKTGQVYSFGNAWHSGSNPSNVPGEVADISYRRDGVNGYLIVGTGGHHYAYNTPWIGNPVLQGAIF